jgi:hypothetical protein
VLGKLSARNRQKRSSKTVPVDVAGIGVEVAIAQYAALAYGLAGVDF